MTTPTAEEIAAIRERNFDGFTSCDDVVRQLEADRDSLLAALDANEAAFDDEEAAHQETLRMLDIERSAFKNFHRSLCDRFGYEHDEVDWKRDQCSLEEWIAKKLAVETAGRNQAVDMLNDEVNETLRLRSIVEPLEKIVRDLSAIHGNGFDFIADGLLLRNRAIEVLKAMDAVHPEPAREGM